jgi:glycosyltransferase involved in cell wall biosynthesis
LRTGDTDEMAIVVVYGVDTSIEQEIQKGNISQMQTEINNFSSLSKIYLLTMDYCSYDSLFNNNVIHIPCGFKVRSNSFIVRFLFSIIYVFRSFFEIMKRRKDIELMVSQGTTTLQCVVASGIIKVPFILFIHYLSYQEELILKRKLLATIFWAIESYTIAHADQIIALSQKIKSQVLPLNMRVQIIPNYVDVKVTDRLDRKQLREKYQFGESLKVILFVGRLHPVKNVDFLLKAYKHIVSEVNSKVVILGDGPERMPLEALAKDLDIADKVDFKGFVLKDEVLEYMNASDILVLPSLVEGQPRVILEAWACGLPVVAAKSSGLQDLINDGIDGILFDVHSEKELVNAIIGALKAAKSNLLIENGEKRVKEFEKERILSMQIEAIQTLLNKTILSKTRLS